MVKKWFIKGTDFELTSAAQRGGPAGYRQAPEITFRLPLPTGYGWSPIYNVPAKWAEEREVFSIPEDATHVEMYSYVYERKEGGGWKRRGSGSRTILYDNGLAVAASSPDLRHHPRFFKEVT